MIATLLEHGDDGTVHGVIIDTRADKVLWITNDHESAEAATRAALDWVSNYLFNSPSEEQKMFACLECGRKFRTANAAYRAAMNGCPKCGGVDIDVDSAPSKPRAASAPAPDVLTFGSERNGEPAPEGPKPAA